MVLRWPRLLHQPLLGFAFLDNQGPVRIDVFALPYLSEIEGYLLIACSSRNPDVDCVSLFPDPKAGLERDADTAKGAEESRSPAKKVHLYPSGVAGL